MWLLSVLVAACAACSPVSVVQPNTTQTKVLLGDTVVFVARYESGQPPFLFGFLNLHQNENTSVVAAKALIAASSFSGSITYLLHGGTRDLEFVVGGRRYSIDPNRMFTPVGRKTYLQPYDAAADAAVAAFATRVLELYGFAEQRIVLTLHNNGPGYDATDYLPGHVCASAAQAVAIGKQFSPRDFFYVVPGNWTTDIYHCLAQSGLNAVLQVSEAPPDDGSLSVLAGQQGRAYINTENAAEAGAEGDRVIDQLLNLQALVTILQQSQP